MSDLIIFGFGFVVTAIVGAGLTMAIVANNRTLSDKLDGARPVVRKPEP